MFLTPEAVKRLICPYMSRATLPVKCNADGCPLWRWGGFTRLTRGERTWSVVKNRNEIAREIASVEDKLARVGFCGAGGYPERDES